VDNIGIERGIHMSNEIRETVDRILADADVSFFATYRGERRNPLGFEPTSAGRENVMDEWECRFTFPGKPREPETFQYFKGLGLRKNGRPAPPHAADVLYALILDSYAAEMTFASWCAEHGYDTDSRKALTIYLACQENADKLARIFDHTTREHLREALQDY